MTPTRTIRVPVDLAEMIAAILRHQRTKSFALVEPHLRRPIERMFHALPETDRKYTMERISRLKADVTPAAK